MNVDEATKIVKKTLLEVIVTDDEHKAFEFLNLILSEHEAMQERLHEIEEISVEKNGLSRWRSCGEWVYFLPRN